jgi:hypothetical protein
MKKVAFSPKPILVALILAALSLSLQSCRGSLLPAVNTPTRTAMVIPSQTTTPTLKATVPYTEWPLAMSEYFDEEKTGWNVGELNNEYAKGVVIVTGGKYYLKLTAKKPLIWHSIPEMDDLLDAYASVKVDQKAGSKTAEYGIIARDSSAGSFFFGISTLQQGYEFLKYSGGEWGVLTYPTNSSRIRVGEPNQIGVRAMGSRFQLFINGEQVDDAKDKSPTAGKLGIAVALYKAGDWIEIVFDNFEVRTPPAG